MALNFPGFGMYREHTQRRQIGSVATSRFLRNCKASRLFRISDKDRSRVFPKGRWKKHGRTSPPASTTAETQGALQRGATGFICPRHARKCSTMRRSLAGLSAMKPDARPRECSADQGFNLPLQRFYLVAVEGNFVLQLRRRDRRPIERRGTDVGGEKRDGVQADVSSRGGSGA